MSGLEDAMTAAVARRIAIRALTAAQKAGIALPALRSMKMGISSGWASCARPASALTAGHQGASR